MTTDYRKIMDLPKLFTVGTWRRVASWPLGLLISCPSAARPTFLLNTSTYSTLSP